MSKLIVFGANDDGKEFIKLFKASNILNPHEIIAIADNDSRLHGLNYEGFPIISPKGLKELDFDKIVICPIFNEEIMSQLLFLGIPAEKILIWKEEKYFSKVKRKLGANTLGRFSYCKSNTVLINTDIGNFCHIGDNCIIGQAGHRTDIVSTYPLQYHFSNKISDASKDNTGDIRRLQNRTIIMNDVYIGESVVIQGGLTIGNGVVIGSRSLITKDIPDYSIVAGVPAKVIKFRFEQNEIEELLQIAWWNWSDEKLKDEVDTFSLPISDFIGKHSINR